MAVLHKLWMLKASLRSISVYKGEFLSGGLIQYFFYKEASYPLIAIPKVSGSITAAFGLSQSCCSFGSYSTEVFWSSRILAANHNPSTISSIQLHTHLSTKALPHVLSTSTINCPFMQNFRYTSVKVAKKLRGSNLGKHSEAGLYGLPGQIPGVLSQKERTIVPNQGIGIKNSELRIWNEHGWRNKQTQMDRDGVAYVEACKYKSKAITSVDSRSFVIQGIDNLHEANEDSDVEECAVDGHIHEQNRILENVSMQGCLNVQSVTSLSTECYPFDPVSLVSGVQDSHGSFAGEESSDLEFSGCHELRYAGDLSRNLDNEGAQHRNLGLLSGACCLPHPNKVKTGGEDAYFICFEEQVVGVADGVGGWADVGVDAGDYARELMFQSKQAVGQEPHGYINPARVMIRAHARTKCRGSSTACILALSDYGLQAANLGDSGFMLMRNGRTVFKSPVQQHQFNIPFQLESGGSDPPSCAEVFSLEVTAGDVLVAGTDGLFDNLYDNELMGIVIHSTRAGLDPQVTAQKIAALARERAKDCNRQTPFSTAAQEAGFRFYGGKMDDITVIVSYVTSTKPGFSDSPPKL